MSRGSFSLRIPSVLSAPAWPRRPLVDTTTMALLGGLYFALTANAGFLHAVLAGRPWTFGAAMFVMVAAVHVLLLSVLLVGRAAKPVLAALLLASAFATHFMQQYGVVLDPSMLRNVFHTDTAEATELFGWDLLLHLLLYGALPIAVLAWCRTRRLPMGRAILRRSALALGALALAVLALLAVFQDFSSTMRNQKETRYLLTPANLLYSGARALVGDARSAVAVRTPVGTDAKLGPAWTGRAKPVLFVIVVGETARAANWGLNGYARQTTPELAGLDVLNFGDVSACGTNTETSVPCMFSAIGRRDYDEQRIRGSESLLDVLQRAGLDVAWRDNQSGCKGVCAGVPSERACAGERCPDAELLQGIGRDTRGNQVLVLHMLGNHGPAYHRRYPAAFQRFEPACRSDELRQCTTQEIVNAYDNALVYTDHVLAQAIAYLKSQEATHDAALLYVSDHGESLGEKGLYLHGMPYAIAPAEQTHVPMTWWLSPGLRTGFGLDYKCLAAQTAKPWSHDNLFHTVLGLLQISTQVYEPAMDITAACRR